MVKITSKSKTEKTPRIKRTWGDYLHTVPVILMVSLLVNAVLISTIAYVQSPGGDLSLLSHALTNTCERDYAKNLNRINDYKQRAFFSEQTCHRNYKSGELLINTWTSSDGKYSVK